MTHERICAVVAPYEGIYSETFIREHIARLPGPVLPIYGTRSSLRYRGRRIFSRALSASLSEQGRQYLSKRIARFVETRADAALARFWRRNRVRVVLAEYANTAAWLVPSVRHARVPLVVHCHGYDVYSEEVLRQNHKSYAELFRNAAAIIVGSKDMLEHLVSLGAARERVFYNPCGVDIDHFAATNPASNPPIVVAVGRFVEKKAPYATLLAFHIARKSCPEARLLMAGDGPLLNVCKQMSQALGVGDAVQFLGAQEPAQIKSLMQGARAFAQHSVRALNGDSEGTAISVLEASATGLPVIATAHGGIKDTMVDGLTGFLVPELDICGMAERMGQVLKDPMLAQALGEAARRRIVEHFSMQRSIDGIHRVLGQACEAHSSPA
jgi:glycosyltransferase involved in cell wall biosynthesis